VRCQRERPGQLIHIDTKIHIDTRKRGRTVGIGHRITGRRFGVNRHRGVAGNSCTLPSMARA
jgi:hypothetical protein